MRRKLSLSLVATTFLALSLGGIGIANAGISNTKHNMSSSQTTGIRSDTVANSGTDEICIFCHTPHMGAIDKGANLPLWNHKMSSIAASNYLMYKSDTFNGGTLSLTSPDNSVLADSLVTGSMAVTNLCLSCHDGTQAVNAMFNPPNRLGADPVMVGGVTKLADGDAAFLGTDLTNDHPVNFSYQASIDDGDGSLHATGCSGACVQNGGETVRLFNGSVQCASCHDPHKDYTGGEAEFTPFLRVTISGSKLCLTCHNK